MNLSNCENCSPLSLEVMYMLLNPVVRGLSLGQTLFLFQYLWNWKEFSVKNCCQTSVCLLIFWRLRCHVGVFSCAFSCFYCRCKFFWTTGICKIITFSLYIFLGSLFFCFKPFFGLNDLGSFLLTQLPDFVSLLLRCPRWRLEAYWILMAVFPEKKFTFFGKYIFYIYIYIFSILSFPYHFLFASLQCCGCAQSQVMANSALPLWKY